MILSPITPTSHFKINEPIWKTPRSVGLDNTKIGNHNSVEILYKKKDGTRLYQFTYYIRGESARKYPIKEWHGTKLYIIPIEDMEILERGNPKPKSIFITDTAKMPKDVVEIFFNN